MKKREVKINIEKQNRNRQNKKIRRFVIFKLYLNLQE